MMQELRWRAHATGERGQHRLSEPPPVDGMERLRAAVDQWHHGVMATRPP